MGVELHAGGRTDGHDEADSMFSQFYERFWKCLAPFLAVSVTSQLFIFVDCISIGAWKWQSAVWSGINTNVSVSNTTLCFIYNKNNILSGRHVSALIRSSSGPLGKQIQEQSVFQCIVAFIEITQHFIYNKKYILSGRHVSAFIRSSSGPLGKHPKAIYISMHCGIYWNNTTLYFIYNKKIYVRATCFGLY